MEPTSICFATMVVSIVVSALIARGRGFSLFLYGALGVFLNLGAIPLTLLLTHERLKGEEDSVPGFTPCEGRGGGTDSQDVSAWREYYLGLRQGLTLGAIAAMAGSVMLTLLAGIYVLPTFVLLFEGMSLKLPLPTLMMISVVRFLQGSGGVSCLWALDLVLPSLAFVMLVYGGYWLPFVGPVWRHCDRIWALYGVTNLPADVKRRMGSVLLASLTSDPPADVTAKIQRERDRLGGALWVAMLLAVPVFGCFVVISLAIVMSIFLPLYQLIGNLG